MPKGVWVEPPGYKDSARFADEILADKTLTRDEVFDKLAVLIKSPHIETIGMVRRISMIAARADAIEVSQKFAEISVENGDIEAGYWAYRSARKEVGSLEPPEKWLPLLLQSDHLDFYPARVLVLRRKFRKFGLLCVPLTFLISTLQFVPYAIRTFRRRT